jgi:hypothetical protein
MAIVKQRRIGVVNGEFSFLDVGCWENDGNSRREGGNTSETGRGRQAGVPHR